jgi:hypothetical protein
MMKIQLRRLPNLADQGLPPSSLSLYGKHPAHPDDSQVIWHSPEDGSKVDPSGIEPDLADPAPLSTHLVDPLDDPFPSPLSDSPSHSS